MRLVGDNSYQAVNHNLAHTLAENATGRQG
jgi:hypothetical protein